MRAYVSFRRFAPAVVLALFALAGPDQAARAADDFQARGTFQVVDSNGTNATFTGDGRASPGGQFTTTVAAHANYGNYHETGTQTLDFGKGDTLTISFADDWVPDADYPNGGYRTGPYVVTGGTGRLAGATGSGTLIGIPNGDGTGKFSLDGTLSR